MNNLEKTFKKGLEDFEYPVTDAVWKGISKSLVQKKRKNRIFLFIIIVLMIFALIGGLYLWNSQNKNTKTKQKPINIETAQVSTSNNNLKKVNHLIQEIGKTESIVTPINEIEKENRSSLSLNTYPNTKNLLNTNLVAADVNFIPNINSFYTSSSNISIDNSNKSLFSNRTKAIFKPINKIELKPFLINTNLNYSKYSSDYYKRNSQGILNDCFPIRTNTWFVELYFSPDYNKKSLTGEDYEYINSRFDTEKAAFSFSSGFKVGYEFRNGLNLRSGVDFLKINENFNFQYKKLISTQTIITIDTITLNDGSIEIVRDTTIKSNYENKFISNRNVLSLINIPVILGYQIKKGKNSYGLNLGVIINILSYSRGKILDNNNELIDLENSKNVYESNFGIAIYNSLLYSRAISPQYELFVEPKLKYYLKSFTKQNYPLKQKYVNFAFSLGARYHF